MGKSNLRQQFIRMILGCCKFGEKKHEYKKGTENDGQGWMPKSPWIFSDNYKESLKEFSGMAVRYINENYPEVRMMFQIKKKHWSSLLETKTVTCSTKTLGLYYSHIHKLELCAEQHFAFKHPLEWTKGLKKPESLKTPTGELLRVQQMSEKDFVAIMTYAQRGRAYSRAPIAFNLSRKLGLRVAECADIGAKNIFFEGGRFGYGYAEIWGKGKRYRKIDITSKEDRDYLRRIVFDLKPEDKIVGITKDSINTRLWENMKALNLKKKYPYTATHSIRKLYSQELFKFVQTVEGGKMTEKQAARYVNAQLGHSEERDEELLAVYVKSVKRRREREKENRIAQSELNNK